MKKGILIYAYGSTEWIGGAYYKRNVVFSLLQNEWASQNINIVVLTDEKTRELFECFEEKNNVVVITEKVNEIFLLKLFLRYKIRYSFPDMETHIGKLLGVHAIKWVPDFQHNVYPEYFSKEECETRTERGILIAHEKSALILSSNSAKSDFEKYYPPKKNIYVVPFVSYIEPELQRLNTAIEQSVLGKYHLSNQKYACVCNQFWKHKNHIVVLEAILLLTQQKPDMNIKFVFTGYPKDYRNPEYYNQVQSYFENEHVRPYVEVVGFVDRLEQLALMKNSQFVIQPSLFEGWGTVVEDAKVLDKRILLSDIPVHREQKNAKCTLFNAHNPQELSDKICDMFTTDEECNIDVGIKRMYQEAQKYSKGFEELLRNRG